MPEASSSEAAVWPGQPIRVLLLDVDGTLTDGGMYFSADGLVMKRFDVKDGLGIRLLQAVGVEVALISAVDSPVTLARARHLRIEHVVMACRDKARAVREVLRQRELAPGQACYMGDDLTDLPAFAEVGHPVAPADSVPEVRAAAQYVTRAAAGHGAVREVCDLIRAALPR